MIQEAKNFKPSVEMIKTAQEVFLNMANIEVIKPEVEKIQNKVLNKYKFKSKKRKGEKQTIVLTENKSYLLKDCDFKVYINECRKEEIKIKLIDKSFNKDFCPLLVAEHNLNKAENKLINVVCKELKNKLNGITAEQINRSLNHRKKFIELNLSYLSQFINL